MKTPSPDDLLIAADWCEACQGEDRERMASVAVWLRARADGNKGNVKAAALAVCNANADLIERHGGKVVIGPVTAESIIYKTL